MGILCVIFLASCIAGISAYPQRGVYFGGKFTGTCNKDGYYYNDENSFIRCVNSMAVTQKCAPGTMNGSEDDYQADTYYLTSPLFCHLTKRRVTYTVQPPTAMPTEPAQTMTVTVQPPTAMPTEPEPTGTVTVQPPTAMPTEPEPTGTVTVQPPTAMPMEPEPMVTVTDQPPTAMPTEPEPMQDIEEAFLNNANIDDEPESEGLTRVSEPSAISSQTRRVGLNSGNVNGNSRSSNTASSEPARVSNNAVPQSDASVVLQSDARAVPQTDATNVPQSDASTMLQPVISSTSDDTSVNSDTITADESSGEMDTELASTEPVLLSNQPAQANSVSNFAASVAPVSPQADEFASFVQATGRQNAEFSETQAIRTVNRDSSRPDIGLLDLIMNYDELEGRSFGGDRAAQNEERPRRRKTRFRSVVPIRSDERKRKNDRNQDKPDLIMTYNEFQGRSFGEDHAAQHEEQPRRIKPRFKSEVATRSHENKRKNNRNQDEPDYRSDEDNDKSPRYSYKDTESNYESEKQSHENKRSRYEHGEYGPWYRPNGSDRPRYGPIEPEYGPDGPEFGPEGPVLGPDGPVFGLEGPVLGPDGPIYGIDLPKYGYDGHIYAPEGPIYGPPEPIYGPHGPTYGPDEPRYGMDVYRYGPDGPPYVPDGPLYGPDSPRYGPNGPMYGPDEPGHKAWHGLHDEVYGLDKPWAKKDTHNLSSSKTFETLHSEPVFTDPEYKHEPQYEKERKYLTPMYDRDPRFGEFY